MGTYRTDNEEHGRILAGSNSDFHIGIYRCEPQPWGGERCVFRDARPGEYYLELFSMDTNFATVSHRDPILFSIRTVIDIYDRQIEAGDVEYNWLDDYDPPTVSPGENIHAGCYACGYNTKTLSELKSDNVDTTRDAYCEDEFHTLFDISSIRLGASALKWHEDCVLTYINPAINQAVQICKKEGAMEHLRDDPFVPPREFTD